MSRASSLACLAAGAMLGFGGMAAQAATVTFTQLAGVTGGSPAATAVFRADLSGVGLGQIASIVIQDSNSGIGGAGGQFSGFDLDAVVISTVLITDAADIALLTPAAVLDIAGSILVAGTQRAPADPALFGTSGGQVDNAVATLTAFDGDSIAGPGADGFVSLGDGGRLSINLVAPLPVSTPLYLYIGEVGDNGEVADGTVTLSSDPVRVSEPVSLALLGIGIAGLAAVRRRRPTA
ncbi:PEP-CTERM sorting domain-containing protein [Falsiroseomonas oryzae]|uniref:PEP-CTERM sorting domain-containing protein n=1 Tax=Falsiroseomonas oryzae TaxID=2766473 RepID=UPI0022EA6A3D|nr:PEP-CTERM sorting domain-containing protein [Roseomonas sp. MO-31]